ncbi:DNA-formamidopyrimidine glycosylase family protein [Rathayibacter sp. KR2-224]|uniref:DNA-formamidopyrimidine glycosylase family protein n=1 Tax=Rathayibacter sp. KR2-224 TaxID=3400913 RepID=UPI003C10EF29
MPELPEVHALAADLDRRLRGRVIDRLDVTSFAALKTFDPPVSDLRGTRVVGVGRHGKFLDIAATLEAGDSGRELHLIIHLARAGWIRWRDTAPVPSARPRGRSTGPLAARLVLERSGEPGDSEQTGTAGDGFDVTEAGTKKSLAIYLVRSPSEVPGIARLGPDPLAPEFTEQVFAGILSSAGRAQIKGVLRNQAKIAGIGNAYSDEILHVAKMSPFKPANMPDDDVHRLYEATQTTLREALERADGLKASELKAEKKSNLRVHGRTGEPCPVCGDTIRQVIYADSTFQYCPTCQTGGKPLADRVLSRLLK